MRSILILTMKDLRRRIAEPLALLINLAIPLAIAGTMALAFGNRGGGAGEDAPRLRIVVVDLDKSPVSGLITGASQNPQAAERMEIKQAADREEGLRLMRDEELAALLIIPEGFGEVVLSGREVELELIKNPAQSVMPVVAQQGAEVVALYLSGAARLLGGDGPRLRSLLEGDGWDDTAALTSLVITIRDRVQSVDELLFPPLIEVRDEDVGQGSAGGFNLISWMYPGMVVMGLLFTGLSQMKDLLRERQAGTLRRQLASPLGPGQVLVGKVISVAVVVAIAHLILVAVGAMAFGIRWGDPLPLAATSALLVLAVTGFAALLFSLVRTERQGDAFGGILVMVMSLMGGAFIPPQLLPGWLDGLSRITVNYWGNESLRGLASGGGWAAIAPYLPVLAALGLVTTGLGVALLRWRHMRGAL